jgi:hypothetical protein
MADRPNDTDPQSPRALALRTDPGLGAPAVLGPRPTPVPATTLRGADLSPPPAVPTPSPGSASIEALLDGITGPRPPPAKRDVAPGSTRAYAAARLAPASRRTPLREPLVVSPEPPQVGDGTGRETGPEEEARQRLDPFSTRPVARRPAEERTVYTGRRALLRNLAAVAGSSVVVGLVLLTVVRWNEASHLRKAAAGASAVASPSFGNASAPSVPPAPASESGEPASQAVGAGGAGEVPAGVTVTVGTAALVPPIAANASASAPIAPKPVGSAPKRAKAQPRPSAAAADSLDDLNRQIRH